MVAPGDTWLSVFTLIEGEIFTFDEGRDGERVRVHVGSM